MKNIMLLLTSFLYIAGLWCQTINKVFIEKDEPSAVGVNQQSIDNLISDIKSDKITNIHALLIIKDDRIIIEEYFGDRDRDSMHYVASVTKSFASVLLGIAIDQGFFDADINTVLNQPVKELFPEYQDLISKDSLKDGLLLKHLLTMTASFEWDEHTHPYTSSLNDCNKINHANDPMKFLFSRELIHEPGTDFYYNGGLSLSISYLLEKYTGMSVDKFAEKYLFEPLQITNYRWDNVASGIIDTDGGLNIRPIDMAKLGYLFLNNGIWNNKQIISEEWVKISTKMHIEIPDSPDYGLQWWGGDFNALWKVSPCYMASGHGGQKIFVFPERNMVVVVCQQVFNNPFGEFNNTAILSKYLLPAIENVELEAIATVNPNKYIGRYNSDDSDEYIDISIENDQLIAVANDGSVIKINKYFQDKFMGTAMEIVDVYFEFIPNQLGEIKQLYASFGFNGGMLTKTN